MVVLGDRKAPTTDATYVHKPLTGPVLEDAGWGAFEYGDSDGSGSTASPYVKGMKMLPSMYLGGDNSMLFPLLLNFGAKSTATDGIEKEKMVDVIAGKAAKSHADNEPAGTNNVPVPSAGTYIKNMPSIHRDPGHGGKADTTYGLSPQQGYIKDTMYVYPYKD